MKKNLYYQAVIRRSNPIKTFFYELFLSSCSYPRLLIECIIKRDMGERYFSFARAVILFLFLTLIPIPISKLIVQIDALRTGQGYSSYAEGKMVSKFITWYIFLLIFFYQAVKRRNEICRNPSTFDFGKFSLSTGDLNTRLFKFFVQYFNRDVRFRETIFEPIIFFIAGILFILIRQPVGFLFLISSICYSISYMAAYAQGDNFVMDKIDEMLMSEELENAFILEGVSDKGVAYRTHKPTSEDLRRGLSEEFVMNSSNEFSDVT